MTVPVSQHFISSILDATPYQDNAFGVSRQAEEDRLINGDAVINATIGSLYNEQGSLVALQTVYQTFSEVSNIDKAAYASGIAGNSDFRQTVYQWVNRHQQLDLPHTVIATSGGTGAISLAIKATLDPGMTLLIPQLAWGSYKIMAEQYGLTCQRYPLYNTQGQFDLVGFTESCQSVMKKQGKLVVIINDPCQNPTGQSLTDQDWEKLTVLFNELGQQGPVVVINDVAYFDYAFDQNNVLRYLRHFKTINHNVALLVAFSCSKALTAYGMRLGAAIYWAKDPNDVAAFEAVAQRFARATWSNVNTGMMHCFVSLYQNHYPEYVAEKKTYIDLLQKRSAAFLAEAKQNKLTVCPYTEGFFITVPTENAKISATWQQELKKQHVYVLNFGTGLRVAICSLSVEQCRKTANVMAQTAKTLNL